MKKIRLKKSAKLLLVLISLVVLFIVILSIYFVNTGKVSNNSELVTFEVKEGNSLNTIASSLKEKNLIKSELFYKIYIKLHNASSLQAGTYSLSENMSVKEIVETLENGTIYSKDLVRVTFKEGINIRKFMTLIEENTSITKEEIEQTLKDTKYLDELISTYWFLNDEIKNEQIYYSLEGYLFPDTYEFNKNSKIKDIFKVMLDNTNNKLKDYKKDIENSSYTVHQILTLASIVELEAANSNDRAGVAGVFYNRLENGWSLGSDVTTYYAVKVDMSERDLYQKELDAYNAYNTRSSKMAGKLPVSPICLPSLESIKAAISPTEHNYFYFVADKNKKTYFSKTSSEHVSTVAKLKRDNLWYQY